jgi:hypothetical protein
VGSRLDGRKPRELAGLTWKTSLPAPETDQKTVAAPKICAS